MNKNEALALGIAASIAIVTVQFSSVQTEDSCLVNHSKTQNKFLSGRLGHHPCISKYSVLIGSCVICRIAEYSTIEIVEYSTVG